jgi:excinuclease ABC subunit A
MSADVIRVVGACQNNLKNLHLDIPVNELIVISGVSGSGKSSIGIKIRQVYRVELNKGKG